jgi:SH3-like domain-containing protein
MFKRTVLLFFLLASFPVTSSAELMSVSFSGADIRTAPSAASSKVVVTASRYYPLEVISTENEYYKVKDYRGRTGYIHKSLLKPVKTVVVTSDKVNVRRGPGTNHDVVTQLAQGESAKVINQNDGWVEIQTARGDQGWIADFLVWGE